jgi:hypothetical protein
VGKRVVGHATGRDLAVELEQPAVGLVGVLGDARRPAVGSRNGLVELSMERLQVRPCAIVDRVARMPTDTVRFREAAIASSVLRHGPTATVLTGAVGSCDGSGRPTKAERLADRTLVATYHEARLADLLERVRHGSDRSEAGEIDAFELDEVIHHYKRAARELWKRCAVSGSQVSFVARTLERWQAEGEMPDWWEAGAARRRR